MATHRIVQSCMTQRGPQIGMVDFFFGGGVRGGVAGYATMHSELCAA